jgi:hypothetical protein
MALGKKMIGGRKKKVEEDKKTITKKNKKEEVQEEVKRGRGRPKKGSEPVAKKEEKKSTPRKKYAVKDKYNTTITKLYGECEELMSNATEPLGDFLDKGNKSAAKNARNILNDLRKTVIALWRLINEARKDMAVK